MYRKHLKACEKIYGKSKEWNYKNGNCSLCGQWYTYVKRHEKRCKGKVKKEYEEINCEICNNEISRNGYKNHTKICGAYKRIRRVFSNEKKKK